MSGGAGRGPRIDAYRQIRLMHAYAFSIAEKTATTAARTLKKMQERTILRGNHQSSQRHGKERGGTRPQLPKPIPRLPAEWLACRLVLQHVVSRSVNVSEKAKRTACSPLYTMWCMP